MFSSEFPNDIDIDESGVLRDSMFSFDCHIPYCAKFRDAVHNMGTAEAQQLHFAPNPIIQSS